jgi:hypothetical protein
MTEAVLVNQPTTDDVERALGRLGIEDHPVDSRDAALGRL